MASAFPVQAPNVPVVPEAEEVGGLSLALPTALKFVVLLGAGICVGRHAGPGRCGCCGNILPRV